MNPNNWLRFRKRGSAWLSKSGFLIVQIGKQYHCFHKDRDLGGFHDRTWVNGPFYNFREAIVYCEELLNKK